MASQTDEDDIVNATSALDINTNGGAPQAHQSTEASRNLDGTTERQSQARTKARDITVEFFGASNALRTGQLIKDEYFTMFESVGAIEVMDPKMDSGYVEPGDTLEDDYDVLRDLSCKEFLGIMDQLLCHEMAWHHGAPLSQTLFTSLYVDRLLWPDTKTLEEAQFFRGREPAWKNRPLMQALRAYCLGLIKTCDLVIRTVISQHYYEEEDFVTMTYNRDLLTRYETLDVMALLVDAVSSFSNWCEERDVPVELRSAIVIRLDARHSFLAAVSTDYPSVVMKRNLTTLCGMLGKFGETHNLGRPVKEAFSEKVQRRLATTVPPRHMAEMSFRDAVTKLEKMLQDIHAALLVEETGAFKDPYNLVKFLQFWNVRESLTFARAKLQSWLFGDLKVAPSIEKLLLKDVKGLVLREDKLLDPINWTVEVPADPRHQIASLIDNFRQRASMDYQNMYQSLCQNRCRVRRNFCHVIQQFDQLQQEAEAIDTELHALSRENWIIEEGPESEPIPYFPLTYWVYYHKVCQMEWIVELGFEQDIYAPDELALMYWYLQHLTASRVEHLERIRLFLSHRHERLSREDRKTEKARSMLLTLGYNTNLTAEAIAIHSLALSLFTLYSLLNYLKLLGGEDRPCSSDRLRYKLRMKPFFHISTPELPAYVDVWDPVYASGGSQEQCNKAEDALKTAKEQITVLKSLGPQEMKYVGNEVEYQNHVRQMLRSCIATGVAIATVRAACAKYASKDEADSLHKGVLRSVLNVEIPNPETRYAARWAVPKITQKKAKS